MIEYKIKLRRVYTSEVTIMARNGEQAVKKAMKTPFPSNPEFEPEILSAKTEEDIKKAASIIARYSDVASEVEMEVAYKSSGEDVTSSITVTSAGENELNMMRI